MFDQSTLLQSIQVYPQSRIAMNNLLGLEITARRSARS